MMLKCPKCYAILKNNECPDCGLNVSVYNNKKDQQPELLKCEVCSKKGREIQDQKTTHVFCSDHYNQWDIKRRNFNQLLYRKDLQASSCSSVATRDIYIAMRYNSELLAYEAVKSFYLNETPDFKLLEQKYLGWMH